MPLSKRAALERIAPMKRWYRVRLLRSGDVSHVRYIADIEANTPWDALAMIEQRCVVDHPGDVYEFDGCERVWHPRPT